MVTLSESLGGFVRPVGKDSRRTMDENTDEPRPRSDGLSRGNFRDKGRYKALKALEDGTAIGGRSYL